MAGQIVDTNLFAEFLSQSSDLLASMRRFREKLLRDASDMNAVREFYRQMHTLKGNAAMFGFTAMKELAHAQEDLLDGLWQGRIDAAHDVMSALGRGLTIQEQLLARVTPENSESIELDDKAKRFLDYLDKAFCPAESPQQRYDQLLVRLGWLCDELVRPDDTIDEAAIAALLSVVRGGSGEDDSSSIAKTESMPAETGPEDGSADGDIRYLYGALDLTRPVSIMRRTLDACAAAADPDSVDVAGRFAEATALLTEIVCGTDLETVAVTLGEETQTIACSGMPIDDTLRGLLEESLEELVKRLEVRRHSEEADASAAGPRSLRVPEAKLRAIEEELQDHERLIGVLEGILEKASSDGTPADMTTSLRRFHDAFSGGQRRLRRNVAGLIREPLSQLFRNMPLLVEELTSDLDRQVTLRVIAEDAMAPRNVIEGLEGALVHLVRNAVGHGIESPAERSRLGKPAAGVVVLEAFVENGELIVTIRDDGRGLDAERIRQAALEKKIVDETALETMTPDEILRLVLAPSCSTAASVTGLSGRGMGLDMVDGLVQALGGRLDIGSRPGEGAAFSIRLPLISTMAGLSLAMSQ